MLYSACREWFSITRKLSLEAAISKKKKGKKKLAEENGTGRHPRAAVRGYDSHVFVCEGGDCKKRGSKGVRKALKGELRERGMGRDVRVDDVGCLGLCKHGPNVIVYHEAKPGGTWYLGLSEGDVPEVVGRHLKDGEPVEKLAAGIRPRRRTK